MQEVTDSSSVSPTTPVLELQPPSGGFFCADTIKRRLTALFSVMKTEFLTAATILLTVSLLGACGSALYYRSLAADYETRWGDAMSKLAGAIRTPTPSKAFPTPTLQTPSPTNNTAELNALLTELERKEQEIAPLQSATNRMERPFGARLSPEEMQSRIEAMKESDPERYAEIAARRKEIKNRVQAAFAERASILLRRTPADLNEEEYALREIMLQTLDETWSLSEKLTSGDLSWEERQETFQTLRENSEILKPLLEEERASQLYHLGISSGYTAVEAEEFVKYINETIQATTIPSIGGRRRR